jgi:hypothetical protein
VAEQPDYLDAFCDGRRVATFAGEVMLKCIDVGPLVLATGRIIACDPLVSPETVAFRTRVPPGTYPVVLSVARYANGDERVARAQVQFSRGRVKAWQMAVQPGQREGD